MLILAIDTALDACAACVLDTDAASVIAQKSQAMKRGHAEALMPLIGRVIREVRRSLAALDRIAVTTGPGSLPGCGSDCPPRAALGWPPINRWWGSLH